MRLGEDVYMVDLIPFLVVHIAREQTINICRENYRSAPDKGYSVQQYFISYKLNLLVTLNGIYHSMDLIKVNVHGVYYLKDIKYSELNQCLPLADKGYLLAHQQLELFEYASIELQTPMCSHIGYRRPQEFKKSRRCIETVFSQLCVQIMLKRNYAKTFAGPTTWICFKIAAFILLQYIKFQQGKPINQVKHALAA